MNRKEFLKQQWEDIVQNYESQKLIENGYIRKTNIAKEFSRRV